MSIRIFWFHFEDFFAFREAFLGMQPVNQILAFIALVAITVGAILLAYYIVKASVIFVFRVFRWMFRSLKAFFKSLHSDAKHARHPHRSHVHHHRPHPHHAPHPPHRPHPPHAPHPPHRPHPPHAPRPPVEAKMPPVPPVAPVPPIAPQPPVSSVPHVPQPPRSRTVNSSASHADSNLFCPMCGEPFTADMMKLLDKEERVFCEYCGKQLEYIIQ